MPDIHDRGRALAIRMLAPRPKGKGAPLSIVRTEEGAFDPETGENTVVTNTYDGSGLRSSYDARFVDGAIIQQGDWRILVSPVLVNGADMPEPELTDKLVMLGETYSIISRESWNYAGAQCGWAIQARRS